MNSQSSDDPELQAFLSKIDTVSKQVQQLVSAPNDDSEREELPESIRLDGETGTWMTRAGKGGAKDYSYFCRRCFLEFVLRNKEENPAPTLAGCLHCHSEVQSAEERHSELEAKVEVLKAEKEKHRQRKDRFKAFIQAKKEKSRFTDYGAWDFWEPPSDSDDEVLSAENPSLIALEADIQRRNKERKEREKEAEERKQQGNESFAKKDYKSAAFNYDRAIDLIRDNKSYYTNRAAAYLQLGAYDAAARDCSTCLEIAEFLEKIPITAPEAPPAGSRKVNYDPLVVKARLRRAAALRALNQFKEALEDATQAARMRPDDPECASLVEKLTKDIEDEATKERLKPKSNVIDATLSSETKSDNQTAPSTTPSDLAVPSAEDENKLSPLDLPLPTEFVGLDRLKSIKLAVVHINNFHEAACAARAEGPAPVPKDLVSKLNITRPRAAESLRAVFMLLTGAAKNDDGSLPSETDLEEARVYFRECGGLDLCLKLLVAPSTGELLSGVAQSLLASCPNQRNFETMMQRQVMESIRARLQLRDKQISAAIEPALELLHSLSMRPEGRVQAGRFANEWYSVLHGLLFPSDVSLVLSQGAASTALAVLCNFSFDKTFKQRMRTADPPLSPLLLTLLDKSAPLLKKSSKSLILQQTALQMQASVLAVLQNLLTDKELRAGLLQEEARQEALGRVLSGLLTAYEGLEASAPEAPAQLVDALEKCCAVLFNCAVEGNAHVKFVPSSSVPKLLSIFKDARFPLTTREAVLALISRAAKAPAESNRKSVIQNNGLALFLSIISSRLSAAEPEKDAWTVEACEHAIRGLSLCCQSAATSDLASVLSSRVNPIPPKSESKADQGAARTGYEVLIAATDIKLFKETTAGNAALCISQICQPTHGPALTQFLEGFHTAVPPLIGLLRSDQPSIQKNAAIALARLSMHPKNLQKIRELRGTEMLMQIMPSLKL